MYNKNYLKISIINNQKKKSKNGYKYLNREVNFGEGLLAFINYDFSDFINYVNKQFNNIAKGTNIMILYDSISNYGNPNENLIHLNILLSKMQEFSDSINWSNDNMFISSEDDINFYIKDINKYIGNLIPCQKEYKSIINFIYNNENTDIMNLSLNKRLWLYKMINIPEYNDKLFSYKSNRDMNITLNTYKSTIYSKNRFQVTHLKPITDNIKINDYILEAQKIDDEPNIIYSLYFDDIYDFCNFELMQIIKNNIDIKTCKNCKKYIINTDKKRIYCSIHCKNQHFTNLKKDRFYTVYNKVYKKWNLNCSVNDYPKEYSHLKDLLTSVRNNSLNENKYFAKMQDYLKVYPDDDDFKL